MKKLSIIIVTYNSEKDIYDCIDAIRKHADIECEELELIVVDNNSPQCEQMFATITQRYGNIITLVKNTCNGGYGQGNNIGIRMAQAPYLMIMNPDVRLTHPMMKKVLAYMDSHPQTGIYGMKQLLGNGSMSLNSFNCTHHMNGYLRIVLTAIANRTGWFWPSCMYVSGSCFIIRKKEFETAGLFDETIFMYGEEDDIFMRMKNLGMKTFFDHHSRYAHLTDNRPLNFETEKKVIESVIKINEKHGWSADRTLKNAIRETNMLLWRERISKALGKDHGTTEFWQQWRNYLRQRRKDVYSQELS